MKEMTIPRESSREVTGKRQATSKQIQRRERKSNQTKKEL